MNTPVIPQYKDRKAFLSTSVRLTQKQLDDLERLKGASNSPSLGKTLDTFIDAEYQAMTNGERNPDDFIPQDERKTCTLSFKASIAYKETVAELQHFYGAPSMSAVVAHIIDWYTRILEQNPEPVSNPTEHNPELYLDTELDPLLAKRTKLKRGTEIIHKQGR